MLHIKQISMNLCHFMHKVIECKQNGESRNLYSEGLKKEI